MNTLRSSTKLWLVVLAVVCGTAISALAQEINIVVPNDLENIEGDSSVDFGFSGSFRVQVAYSAEEFNELPDTHRSITAISFRPDAAITEPRTVDWGDTQLFLSTTTRDVNDRSTVFSENHGPNQTLVYSGPLVLSTEATGPTEGPRAFDYTVNLQTPFLYDPNQGNLVVDFTSPSGYTPNFGDDQFSGTNQQLLDIPFAGSESGFFVSNGLILQLTFVPEPSSFTLGAIGIVALFSRRRCARQLQHTHTLRA